MKKGTKPDPSNRPPTETEIKEAIISDQQKHVAVDETLSVEDIKKKQDGGAILSLSEKLALKTEEERVANVKSLTSNSSTGSIPRGPTKASASAPPPIDLTKLESKQGSAPASKASIAPIKR
jgi:hypothetical protein